MTLTKNLEKVFGVVVVFLLISMACFTAGCITPDNSESVETNNGVQSIEIGCSIGTLGTSPDHKGASPYHKELRYSGWIDRSGEKTILLNEGNSRTFGGMTTLEVKINDTVNYCGTKFVIVGLDGDKLIFKYI